jgi:hypothetical protein
MCRELEQGFFWQVPWLTSRQVCTLQGTLGRRMRHVARAAKSESAKVEAYSAIQTINSRSTMIPNDDRSLNIRDPSARISADFSPVPMDVC